MADNVVAYGFHNLEDYFDLNLQDTRAPNIGDALNQAFATYSRIMDGMMQVLVEPTTNFKERWRQAGAGTLQPLSENGRPKPTRNIEHYEVAYPLQRGGDSWGGNREARAKMTIGDVNRNVVEAMRKDKDWMIRHILAAMMDNTNWDYEDDDDEVGSLTIRALANGSGDSVKYSLRNGTRATDDHYLASADAISDSNNHYETMLSELKEHPSNSGPYVAYIASNLVTSTKGLSDFVAVANPLIQYGTNADLTDSTVDSVLAFGDEVLGSVGSMIVVESSYLPDSYAIAVATGAGQPLAMRQHPEASLQGLQAVPFVENSNYAGVDYYRIAGFGARRRVAACVGYFGVSGTYAVPSAYDAPLEV
ncbi:hypothetical protein GF380_02340 [Candidatus Uhrbacteria bacterium]|nr:hypothetical protein [Candidatus Uhrbacteria bacterium]